MHDEPRSRLPILVSASLAVAGLVLFLALAGAAAGLPAFRDGPAGLLVRGLSWAAFFLPGYLWAAALILFMPGFRPDLLFALVGSLASFAPLAVMARMLEDPAAWAATHPVLGSLGGVAGPVLMGSLAAASAAAVAALRLRLFGSRKPAVERAETIPRVVRLLPAGTAAPSTTEPTPRSDFMVPELPAIPALRSLGTGADDASSPDDASGDAATGDRAAVPVAGTLEAGDATGLEDAAPATVSEADDDSQTDDEPIQVMFGRMDGAFPAGPPDDGMSDEGPANDGTANDPALADGYWDDDEPVDDDGFDGVTTAGVRAALLTRVEVYPDGTHEEAVRASGTMARVKPDPAALKGRTRLERADDPGAKASAPPASTRTIPRKKAVVPYVLPTDGILETYPDGQYWIIDDKTRHAAEILRDTLKEFKIEAEVTGIRKGPVITMFEILPAHGVRLSKIANLCDNIALRLASSSVRIVAPIPGKHAVGIEVPNERRAIVSFREIVESETFRSAKMDVPVILGKDITGEVQVAELTQTPHLLIAGATGSGKSVCVNAIILSILYKRSFNEVKLILIDPKIVELKLYNGVPHLLTPVITEPKRAFQALQYCICEMERRYTMLDAMGVRDVRSYNRKITEKNLATEKLPYIVVVIDEFADLMATTGKELESTLARLAAMSRAVGIHLVLATQRPSIDVITGLIKANIPSRIAFMVASKFDSRIIIDMVGAEKLLGRGDMLYSSATDAFPVRMQGAFVSEEEVERVVAHVKTLGEPDYIDDEIFIDDEDDDEGPSLFDDEDDDPLYEKALEIVMAQGKASASFLQRKLKIGYNRAARLVELMEEKGIVGKAQGSKPRDLVHNPEFGTLRPPSARARYVPDFGPDDDEGSADLADDIEKVDEDAGDVVD